MIDFEKKKVAILGFGVEGRDAFDFLVKNKAQVVVFDKKTFEELKLPVSITKRAKFVCGKDYLKKGLENFDMIVRSPGVYRYLPEIVAAEEKGVKVTSPTKIFFDLSPAKIIGVTGTKGKGTTATLIYEILKAQRYDVYLAGNIGKSYLGLLPKLLKSSWVVMELSSFQLIDLHKSPHVAVVLNITEDHLDWHRGRKEYVEAKKNIVRHQSPSDYAVINKDYPTPRGFAKETKAKVVYFSKQGVGNVIKKVLLLRGEHNLENVAAAVVVAKILKISDKVILEVVRRFKGLEHRLELVRKVGGVSFYNDSFATGPQPTTAAIKSFSEPLTLILGGYDKGLNYTSLIKQIRETKNVMTIVLIGDLAKKFARLLKGVSKDKKIINLDKKKMKEIVRVSKLNTPKGGVVLFSPAAASFDMFEDYKDRGIQFKEAVKSLG